MMKFDQNCPLSGFRMHQVHLVLLAVGAPHKQIFGQHLQSELLQPSKAQQARAAEYTLMKCFQRSWQNYDMDVPQAGSDIHKYKICMCIYI